MSVSAWDVERTNPLPINQNDDNRGEEPGESNGATGGLASNRTGQQNQVSVSA